jgi:hypothetical protein
MLLEFDRRKYRRVLTDDVIAVHRVKAGTQLGSAVDLGLGGIRFQLPGLECEVGDFLEVTFNLGESTAVIGGKVIRVTEVGPLVQEVVVQFLEIGDETRTRFEELGLAPGTEEPEE